MPIKSYLGECRSDQVVEPILLGRATIDLCTKAGAIGLRGDNHFRRRRPRPSRCLVLSSIVTQFGPASAPLRRPLPIFFPRVAGDLVAADLPP